MRDLEIWEQLSPPPRSPTLLPDEDPPPRPIAEILAALEQLREAPFRERVAFFELVSRHVEHEDARVRAAAIGSLAGATGIEGLRAIVRALDDEVYEVRLAAIAALAEINRGGHAWRFAHALFHPRPDVRAAAIQQTPPEIAWVLGYLRADHYSEEFARGFFLPNNLRLAIELHDRGLATTTELCMVLASCDDGELLELLRYGQRRTRDELGDARRWLDGDGPAPDGHDLLDDLIAVIDHGGIPAAIPPFVRIAKRANIGERLVAAIVLRLVARNDIHDALLTLAVRLDPTILAAEVIPVWLRQSAALLYAKREPRSRVEDELATRLLGSPLIRRGGDELHLRVAASVAWLLPAPKHGRLIALIGVDEVVARLELGDVEGFMALSELPPPTPELLEAHPELEHCAALDLLARVSARQRPLLHAAALASWATQWPRAQALIEALASAELIACVAPLLDTIDGHAVTLTEKAALRLAGLIVDAIDSSERVALVQALIRDAELRPLKAAIIDRSLREAEPARLALLVAGTEARLLVRLTRWLHEQIQLPVAVEQALAEHLRAHADAAVREAAAGLHAPTVVVAERPIVSEVARLTEAQHQAISTCAFAKLGNALAPALAGPSLGLTAALAERADERPSLEVCLALLGCHDPLEEVGRWFADYFEPSLEQTAIAAAVTLWQRNPGLPPLGHAWLHNFEQHAFAFGEWLVGYDQGPIAALDLCASLTAPVLRIRCYEAAAYVFALWRYRELDQLARLELGGLPTRLVAQLDTELGPAAAKLLVTLYLSGQCRPELDSLQQRVLTIAPDLDRVTRHELHRWLKIDGLPDREHGARSELTAVRGDLLAEIRTTEDLELLAEACKRPSLAIVEEAVLRLLEFGEAGELRIAVALSETIPPPRFDVLVASIAMWTSAACVDDVRALANDRELVPELRFRLALALAERGEREQVEVAIEVLREPGPTGWFRLRDWDALGEHASEGALAFALADSVHANAYQRALGWLLAQPAGDRTVLEPLRRFLDAGTKRPTRLRIAAANRLLLAGEVAVAPVLLAKMIEPDCADPDFAWLVRLPPEPRALVIDAAVSATLIGGQEACKQRRISAMLDITGLGHGGAAAHEAVDRALRRMFLECTDDAVRTHLALRATSPTWRKTKLRGLAEIFAWGVRRGRELTGRLFRVHMTDRRHDFGYTMLDEDRIFVTPLPYFAGDRHGKQIVEALILHELGHHVHHRGERAAEIWKLAQKRGLHGVLNLVADEHLERNLRAFRADYGDRLKRLAAHAFLHAERDVSWPWLLEQLGASAFAILSSRPTRPAHARDALRVARGDLMQALEAGGSSWTRFARALRMGLGDRWDDAKVRAGLELFKGPFRHADMDELWRITEALAELFAGELPLAQVCGGHETLGDATREGEVARGGIAEQEVQEEVERILDPRQLQKGAGERSRMPSKLAINVAEDERFDAITNVQRVARDPQAHREIAREVKRHADHLRRYLCELGLDLVPRRARLRGRSFDRTRVQAVVLRGDPRMLVARELEVHSDLFIGVLIDCSGSMAIRDLLAKACRFAVLIAEAVRGLPGVDARFWGFTDSVIWDAGDAERCAVTSLETSGGNNDAAALLHAAQVAAGTRRRSRLLVMISDGLPTECSVAALRNLVMQLGRRQQIVCAQVAVRPIEEVCFPHHVLLVDEPIELATVRFGQLVSKLARQALGKR